MVPACLQLAKVPLCLLIGCSTFFGNVLADPLFSFQTLLAGTGVFFLAMGAATLNSIQEHRLDGEMERTKNRPLPQGLITLIQATIQAVLLFSIGMAILATSFNSLVPFLVSLTAVVLYNGIYTPLKRKTVMAIIPGALSGALPPYIGWLAGGGAALAFGGVLLIALLVLWQVPHFWLVLLNHKDDYLKSRFPHLLEDFKEEALKRFFCTWIGGLVIVMLMFTLLPYNFGFLVWTAALVNSLILLTVFLLELGLKQRSNYKVLFRSLNGVLFFHMVIFSSGRLF
jgi:protoheme IX farnesyltransferase